MDFVFHFLRQTNNLNMFSVLAFFIYLMRIPRFGNHRLFYATQKLTSKLGSTHEDLSLSLNKRCRDIAVVFVYNFSLPVFAVWHRAPIFHWSKRLDGEPVTDIALKGREST